MSTKPADRSAITITCGVSGGAPVSGVRLHVTVLDYIPNAGIVAAGWLSDMPPAIAAVTLGQGTGPEVDLLREATVALTPELSAAFGIAPETGARRAFVLFLPGGSVKWAGGLRLRICHDSGAVDHGFARASGHFSDLGRIFELAPSDQALRLVELLLARCGGTEPEAPPPVIETWMARLHQRMGVQPGIKGGIDEVVRVGTSGMLLRGRLSVATLEQGAAIALVSLAGRRVALETPLSAVAARGEGSGFAFFAAILGLRPDERFWFVEVTSADGRIERIPFRCPPPEPPLRGIEAALGLLEPLPHDPERVLQHAIAPAVDSFWASAYQGVRLATSAAYGEAAGAPEVSVIVPLDGQIERMRHQIAQFSNDPEFCSGGMVELIYVVDNVSVTEQLPRLALSLLGIYGVPFRTLELDRSCGPAAAGNAGARAASGNVLLFLGADVLPKQSGWVGQLLQSYRALDRRGVLGCRLLFEDDSIRHGGITFRASASQPGLWEEHDTAKGLPSDFERRRGAFRVPAVTRSCLMIDRAVFHQLGGFAEEYVYGEFADYDLCCAAQQRGRHVYYTPEVELYQLAAVAPVGEARWQEPLTLYNRWKHSHKWRSLIPTLPAAGVGT